MSDVSLCKLADRSSPILAQTCAAGKTIPEVKFEFFRADGSGTRVKYIEIDLSKGLQRERLLNQTATIFSPTAMLIKATWTTALTVSTVRKALRR